VNRPEGLALYDCAARRAAAAVIDEYSTSFGLACRLLGPRVRQHVRVVYALVRVADEIVDGPAAESGLDRDRTRSVLDGLESETLAAIERGFSANLIAHAFALTARECAIDAELVRPFFASMRSDLDVESHDDRTRDEYIYGSAEVVGLMCLQVFVNAGSPRPGPPDPVLREGARRLGAAFQEINFLRDADHDRDRLGRDYLGFGDVPGAKDRALRRIDRDLRIACEAITMLPRDCRVAVAVAHDLFQALAMRLRAESSGRVRVTNFRKAAIAIRAALAQAPRGTHGHG
jgi:phytoene synthase